MQTIPQTGMALYNSQIEASQEVAEAMFQSVEKAEKLILDAAKKNFEEQLKFAQSLAAARDPQGVAALQNTFFGNSPERAMEYQKQILQIVMEANSAFGHAMETYMHGVKESANTAGAATAGGGNPAAVMSSIMPMWDAAFKEFTKSANRLMQPGAHSQPARAAAPAAAKPRSTKSH